jgi:hypothetical protein
VADCTCGLHQYRPVCVAAADRCEVGGVDGWDGSRSRRRGCLATGGSVPGACAWAWWYATHRTCGGGTWVPDTSATSAPRRRSSAAVEEWAPASRTGRRRWLRTAAWLKLMCVRSLRGWLLARCCAARRRTERDSMQMSWPCSARGGQGEGRRGGVVNEATLDAHRAGEMRGGGGGDRAAEARASGAGAGGAGRRASDGNGGTGHGGQGERHRQSCHAQTVRSEGPHQPARRRGLFCLHWQVAGRRCGRAACCGGWCCSAPRLQ